MKNFTVPLLCRTQIVSAENSIRKKAEIASGNIFLNRYDEEGKIELSDGKEKRVFTCPKESMDICAEIMSDLFCSTSFVNIELSDVEMTDDDRAVLIQTAEGTLGEVTDIDCREVFDNPEELAGIRTVILMLKFPPSGGLSHITKIAEGVREVFPQDCTVLWGVAFDDSLKDRAKICVVGVY